METDDVRFRLDGNSPHSYLRPSGLLAKILTTAVGAVMLVAAFVFSLLVFALVAAGGLLVVSYLWWKTRKLRQQMGEEPVGGRVIEGEVIRRVESGDTDQR